LWPKIAQIMAFLSIAHIIGVDAAHASFLGQPGQAGIFRMLPVVWQCLP
jgi:hypothetical protein